jgi:hypothetical protein
LAANREGGSVKNWPPETVRLAQAALETRDTLRSLAAQIDAAGNDPVRQAEMLRTARVVALTHADILRAALKHSGARRHSLMSPNAQPLWATESKLEP